MSSEDERRHSADTWYEVWRAGGNPDRINDDRVSDAYYRGDSAEDAARTELRRQRPPEEYLEPEGYEQ